MKSKNFKSHNKTLPNLSNSQRELDALKLMALDVAPNAIVITSIDGKILWANPAFTKISGFGINEVMGKNLRFLQSGEHSKAFYTNLWETILSGKTWVGVIRNKRKNGSFYSEEQTITPIINDEGKIQYFIAIKKDITLKIKADKDLTESEARFRNLASSSFEGIGMSVAGIITDANVQMAAILGYEKDELIGMAVKNFVHPDDISIVIENIEAGNENAYEHRAIKKGGEIVSLQVRGKEVFIEGKKQRVTVIRDITESKANQSLTQQRVNELEILLDVHRRIHSHGSLDELLFEIAKTIPDLIPLAQTSSIWLHEEHRNKLEVHAWHGHDDQDVSGLSFPISGNLMGKIFQSGKARIVEDTSKEKGFKNSGVERLDKAHSILGVPLMMDKETIGVLFADNYDDTDIFSENDLRLLSLLANQVENAIENVQLFAKIDDEHQALVKSELEYRTLVNTSPDAVMSTDMEGNFIYVSPVSLRLFGYQDPSELLGQSSLLTLSKHEHEKALNNFGRVLSEGEIQGQEYEFVRKDGSTFIGEFNVSLVMGTNGSDRKTIATIHDVTHRVEAKKLLERKVKELKVLRKTAEISATASDEDLYIEEITALVGRTFFPDHFGVLTYDETDQTLLPHSSYTGVPKNVLGIPFSIDEGISGHVFRTGKAKIVKNSKKSKKFISFMDQPMLSELCVPILMSSSKFGVINAESATRNFFSESDKRLLVTIADQIGSTISRIRLFRSEREQRLRAVSLQDIAANLTGILDPNELFDQILKDVGRVVSYDIADIIRIEDGKPKIVSHRGYPRNLQKFLENFEEVGATQIFEATLKNRETLLISDTHNDPRWTKFEETIFIHSYLSTPLRMHGKVIGLLNLSSRQSSFFSEQDAEKLEAFADQTAIALNNAKTFDELQNANRDLQVAYTETLEGWVTALDLRDQETEGHTRRVVKLTQKLANALGLPPETMIEMNRGALLHDIGKMGISDSILLKPGPLDDDEWVEMRKHPVYAYEWLKEIEFFRDAIDIPYLHHERWDGAGYPVGLQGEDIPYAARIFAVVDVWDALRSDRPYRKAWSDIDAKKHIMNQSGIHFDPEIVKVFFEKVVTN